MTKAHSKEVLVALDEEDFVYYVVGATNAQESGTLVREGKRIPVAFWSYITRARNLQPIETTLFHKRLWNGSKLKGWEERFYSQTKPFKADELMSIGMLTQEDLDAADEANRVAAAKRKASKLREDALQKKRSLAKKDASGHVMETKGLPKAEQEYVTALRRIASKYGKLADQDENGIWVGYQAPEENEDAAIGVKCSNCAFYQGAGSCEIVAQRVQPEGKCRLMALPAGAVKPDGSWMKGKAARVAARRKKVNFQSLPLKFKVGLVESNNPLMRAGQAAATAAIPGNLSAVRRPVRSQIAQALTPGPGGGRSGRGSLVRRALGSLRDGEQNQLRCPPGFQYGGRYAKKDLSNCGMRLFDLPGFGLIPIGPRGNAIPRARRPIEATPTEQAEAQNALDISRTALVAEVGELDNEAREKAIRAATEVAAKVNSPDFGRLVRKDGTIMDNVIPIAQLGDIRTSDDMQQAFIVTPIVQPERVGADAIEAMSGGLDGVVLAFLDGKGFIRIQRAQGGEVRAIRGLRRRWGTLQRDQDPQLPGTALSQLVDDSNGQLEASVSYPGLKDEMALVTIERGGATRQVRRWVYYLFLSSEAPARPKNVAAWRIVDKDQSGNEKSNDEKSA
jgi:hypothetical protein